MSKIGLCKNFGVEFVCLEELVISSKDNNLGKYYNHFKTKKKSKNSYRFLFNDVEKLKWSSLRLKSNKSKIDLIRF